MDLVLLHEVWLFCRNGPDPGLSRLTGCGQAGTIGHFRQIWLIMALSLNNVSLASITLAESLDIASARQFPSARQYP